MNRVQPLNEFAVRKVGTESGDTHHFQPAAGWTASEKVVWVPTFNFPHFQRANTSTRTSPPGVSQARFMPWLL